MGSSSFRQKRGPLKKKVQWSGIKREGSPDVGRVGWGGGVGGGPPFEYVKGKMCNGNEFL